MPPQKGAARLVRTIWTELRMATSVNTIMPPFCKANWTAGTSCESMPATSWQADESCDSMTSSAKRSRDTGLVQGTQGKTYRKSWRLLCLSCLFFHCGIGTAAGANLFCPLSNLQLQSLERLLARLSTSGDSWSQRKLPPNQLHKLPKDI